MVDRSKLCVFLQEMHPHKKICKKLKVCAGFYKALYIRRKEWKAIIQSALISFFAFAQLPPIKLYSPRAEWLRIFLKETQ